MNTIWAIICVALITTTAISRYELYTAKKDYDKLDQAFAEYRTQAEVNAATAQAKIQELETRAIENERKVRDEQEKLLQANALDRADLERTIASLRKQQVRFSAGITADAQSGNVAALAARAATARELFEACSERYKELGDKAESVRLQAVGLYQYVKGNPLASTPFEPPRPQQPPVVIPKEM